jgi:hypothetical protein
MTTHLLLSLAPPEGDACTVCRHGCRCAPDGPACGHYGCRGRGPVTCRGAAAMQDTYEQRLAAHRAQRAALHARRARLSPTWQPPAEQWA